MDVKSLGWVVGVQLVSLGYAVLASIPRYRVSEQQRQMERLISQGSGPSYTEDAMIKKTVAWRNLIKAYLHFCSAFMHTEIRD